MMQADVMQAIRERDPDGKAGKPTKVEYENFKRWVLKEHGIAAWVTYVKMNNVK